MRQFNVSLVTNGGLVQRRIEAADASAIAAALGVPASHIVSVEPVAAQALPVVRSSRRAFPLRLFSQELVVLLTAGIPLLEAITTLREKESSASVSAALGTVLKKLEQGETLSAALAACPEAFDELFVAIVSSAERTGQLPQALRSHASYLAWAEQLRSKLLQASIYPVMLIVAGLAVMVFLLIFVVPRFAGLLEGLHGELPAASLALIAVAKVTGGHPVLTALAGLALLLAPVMLLRHEAVRSRLAHALWALPVLGAKLRLLALARLYRTVSMLLSAGVPVVAALQTTQAVVAPQLRESLALVRAAVGNGERLSAAMAQEGLSTPVSLRMLRVGERSGELGAMLGEAAAFYDEELSRLSEVVTRLVNPVLMLIMGALIGSVIVLMYLPIFQLVEQVQ